MSAPGPVVIFAGGTGGAKQKSQAVSLMVGVLKPWPQAPSSENPARGYVASANQRTRSGSPASTQPYVLWRMSWDLCGRKRRYSS